MKLLLLVLALAPAVSRADWKNESVAGIVLNHGNSRSQSWNASQRSAYSWDKNALSLSGHFLRTSSAGVLSAKNWDALLKYERTLSTRFALVASQGVEGDRFAGYLQRYNTDIGPKYYIVQKETDLVWFVEGGYRFTRERRTNGTRESFQKARVYTEAVNKWSESASSRFWVEYIPNFTEGRDWLLNTELSSSAALNDTLAFKLAYLLKYDNQPNPGAGKKRDGMFTTSLVANY